MNGTQITNTATPIVAFLAGLLAAKFAFFDAATWTGILMGIVGLGATVWGAWSTRNNSIINQAAALPEVKQVVTDAATASNSTLKDVTNVVAG